MWIWLGWFLPQFRCVLPRRSPWNPCRARCNSSARKVGPGLLVFRHQGWSLWPQGSRHSHRDPIILLGWDSSRTESSGTVPFAYGIQFLQVLCATYYIFHQNQLQHRHLGSRFLTQCHSGIPTWAQNLTRLRFQSILTWLHRPRLSNMAAYRSWNYPSSLPQSFWRAAVAAQWMVCLDLSAPWWQYPEWAACPLETIPFTTLVPPLPSLYRQSSKVVRFIFWQHLFPMHLYHKCCFHIIFRINQASNYTDLS